MASRNIQLALERAAAKYFWGREKTLAEQAPLVLNNESVLSTNAAGTGTVALIKANASNVVELPTPVQIGSTATAALTFGGGTAASPQSTATADKNFLGFWTKSTATSGDSRGAYIRHYIAGAGGAGEAARIFGTVLDVAGANAHGAHVSLSFGASGYITGEGIANRNTLQVPNAAMHAAGTYAAHQAEIWCDGSSSDPSGVTQLSLFRAVLSGDGTGLAKVDDKAALIAIDGSAIGAGNIIAAKSSANAVTHTARISINGTPYYIMLSNVQ